MLCLLLSQRSDVGGVISGFRPHTEVTERSIYILIYLLSLERSIIGLLDDFGNFALCISFSYSVA